MAGLNYTAKGYTDKAGISNYLLLDIDSSFDSQLEDWIADAENRVDKYLGYGDYTTTSGILREEIVEEVTKGYVDEFLNLRIFPKKLPIESISAITLFKGTTNVNLQLENGLGVEKYIVPKTRDQIIFPQYEIELAGNLSVTSFYSLRNRDFYVKLSYVGGYSQVPPPIRMATTMLVSDTVMRHNNKEGLEFISQGRVSKRWASKLGDEGQSDFERDAWRTLKPYRISSNWLI